MSPAQHNAQTVAAPQHPIRLSSVTSRALGVAAIRIALGAGGIAAALLRGLDPLPAFLAATAGVVVLTFIALGQGSRAGLREQAGPRPVPPDAGRDPAWVAALLACVPSTAGVGVMTVAALVFSPALAAVLSGVLLAMGVLALVSGIELVLRERREGVRHWVGRGPRPERFVSAR